jgi:hypothetical protein
VLEQLLEPSQFLIEFKTRLWITFGQIARLEWGGLLLIACSVGLFILFSLIVSGYWSVLPSKS